MQDINDNPDRRDFDPELEADVLIGRIIDGEALEGDYLQFDQLAAGEPSLWRTLAERQRDAVRLSDAVREVVDDAEPVALPGGRRRLAWPLALSGWAALVALVVTWALLAPKPAPPLSGTAVAASSPIDHYKSYVNAPYVLDELDPVVLEVEELSDGRIAVTFIRRIEEVAFLDPDSVLPINEYGELTKDIVRLRASESPGRPHPRD